MEYIDKKYWEKCMICNENLLNMKKDFGGKNKYFNSAFFYHLKNKHRITDLNKYFFEHFNIIPPKCPCGICGQNLEISTKGCSKIHWRKMKCGLNEGIKKWSKKAKTSRQGKNNPMFGLPAWNKGLTKETSQWCQNQSIKMKERIKQILKLSKRTKTKPHCAITSFLDQNNIIYEEEKYTGGFFFDIFLVNHNIYIEIDGDYWHCNPKKYPNGPETRHQQYNYTRDVLKNKFCLDNNVKLLRFWESDIKKDINKIGKQILQCIQKK